MPGIKWNQKAGEMKNARDVPNMSDLPDNPPPQIKSKAPGNGSPDTSSDNRTSNLPPTGKSDGPGKSPDTGKALDTGKAANANKVEENGDVKTVTVGESKTLKGYEIRKERALKKLGKRGQDSEHKPIYEVGSKINLVLKMINDGKTKLDHMANDIKLFRATMLKEEEEPVEHAAAAGIPFPLLFAQAPVPDRERLMKSHNREPAQSQMDYFF